MNLNSNCKCINTSNMKSVGNGVTLDVPDVTRNVWNNGRCALHTRCQSIRLAKVDGTVVSNKVTYTMKRRFFYFLLMCFFCNCKLLKKESPYYCSCIANGIAFKDDCGGGFPNFASCNNGLMDTAIHCFTLSANNSSASVSFTIFDSTNQFHSGTYKLSNRENKFSQADYTDYPNGLSGLPDNYYTDSIHCGYVTINFNKANLTASGTFSFIAKYQLDTTTMNVINGKFSAPYTIE